MKETHRSRSLHRLDGGDGSCRHPRSSWSRSSPAPERTETLKSLTAKFEAANPGAKVEIISLPWNEAFQKLSPPWSPPAMCPT